MRRAAILVVAVLVAGCAVDPYSRPPIAGHLERGDDVGNCARLLRAVDRQIDTAGVRDAGSPRVPGFPYLRVDRFTASLEPAAAGLRGAGFSAWSELMAQADRKARAAELANAGLGEKLAAVDACRDAMAVADVDRLPELREAARVPDEYSTAMRALGLYPLTRIPFAAGIGDWQQRTREEFAAQSGKPTPAPPWRRYVPAAAAPELGPAVRSAAFALPAPSAPQLARWVARHAPVLEVETTSADDHLGALVWADGQPPVIAVDTGRIVAYVRTAYTHFGGGVRLQLVYTFWFPARPPGGAFDLLAGRIDGLIWRVTLDGDGAALVYDTIHPCGCYHMFFPTAAVAVRPRPETLDEGMFSPQPAPQAGADERIVLRVQSRTHDLQGVGVRPAASADGVAYALWDESALQRLAWPAGGTRSAYDSAGFVPGTERGERWTFWPMGIASAGQMRQWGRHATAFVGRRHFDDAFLMDEYFEPRAPGAAAND
jgi:hypothetical protein